MADDPKKAAADEKKAAEEARAAALHAQDNPEQPTPTQAELNAANEKAAAGGVDPAEADDEDAKARKAKKAEAEAAQQRTVPPGEYKNR